MQALADPGTGGVPSLGGAGLWGVAVGAGGGGAGSRRHRPAGRPRAGLLFQDPRRQQCDLRPQGLSDATARGVREDRRLRTLRTRHRGPGTRVGSAPAEPGGPRHTASPPAGGSTRGRAAGSAVGGREARPPPNRL